ncbi:16S rRNA (guanine(527)-N(7))-methyltransferase RsmG [Tetragenococcus osmophilus]|uniref:Ribosomal RNA small subunit methyltransferase G n=1 Tax=Tetragenococcus osmophilus TaxID=526944 RepID=A0AA37XKX3_9ENTE|nr:16S rRNA (guanine(527)-N(7))-methyltransferase RsmG [Tetragenococcus osmophilus]AYW47711.1 16S rRNA (guanine(527)-N(7))-methyltransferase RsmG [Tetragenococcus osmophilus]GMA72677.1 ribosomal RNA small subunit methyltransferase G [Tetragenococcus osmophilus]
MLPEEFQQKLREHHIELSSKQIAQFEDYYELLVEWNQKINLTTITDKSEVYLKHFYDSIALAFSFGLNQEASICDIGSGAGFPSIPLKIIFPELRVTIVDSLNKRINFLRTLITELDLNQVELFHARAETFGQEKNHRASYDYVMARAVARLNVLSELCLPLVKKEGYFYALKAAKSQEELVEAKGAIAVLGGKFIEDREIYLPNTQDERHVLVIAKKKETPKKYPRKPGLPNKKPIK